LKIRKKQTEAAIPMAYNTMPQRKEKKEKKDKYWSTYHYGENERLSNMNPTKTG
jgi:hypothetical protein